MTERIEPTPDAGDVVARLASVLQEHGVIVLPLDTGYAVLADAFDRDATSTLRRLRGMTPTAPLSVVVRSPKQLPGITAEVPVEAERLMAAFWPGPLTMILHAASTLQWDIGRTDGTVAVRMPLDDTAIELARTVGPLVCTAAAPVGAPAPRTLDEALDALGEEVAACLDGGALPAMAASSVVDLTRDTGEVLRDGPIPAELIMAVAIGELDPIEAADRLLAPPVPPTPGEPDPEPDPEPAAPEEER
ncbi:MAG: threonylcarbamoyl-AMP synthase [Nitriliruptoraceae bacterium]|nr:threonylcarbamoyl-AMP synthase [Nitriliruptoraceae bacterium]